MGKTTAEKKNAQRKNKINRVKKLIDQGNYPRAMYEVVNYIADYPNETTGHYYYGKLLLRQNMLQPARREFQYVIEYQDQNEVKARMLLASIARLEGDEEEAIRHYRHVIEDSSYQDIYAINVLAHLLRKEKRYEEALATLDLTPSTAYELQIERAKNLSLLGRIEESLNILDSIKPISISEERETMLNKGRLAKEQKDYDKADFYYRMTKEVGKIDDLYYRAVYEQIKMSLEEAKYDQAISFCQELLKAGILFKGEIQLFLGEAKQAQGNYQEAYNHYIEAEVSATDRDIKARSYYLAGSLEFARGDLETAEVSFKRSASTARHPSKETYTKLIGVLFREGKYDETKKYLDKARRANPTWTDPDTPLGYINLLIDKHMGKKMPNRDRVTYAESQIIKYKEKDAIDHIKSHHSQKNKTRGNFHPSIDIEVLYYTIKGSLTTNNLVNEDAMDIYEVDHTNAGYDLNNNLVHRVRVVVFPHTRNILTMYPGCRATVPRQGELVKKQYQKQKTSPKKVENSK